MFIQPQVMCLRSIGLMLRYLENVVHPGQFQNLVDRRLRIDEANGALAAASGFVQSNQCAQAATVDERRLREVDFDMLMRRAKCCARLIPEGIGACRSQFCDFGNSQGVAIILYFHDQTK